MIVAIDSTGFSTAVRGECLRDGWRKHRYFVKVHVAVDVASLQVLAIDVTDDTVGDNRMFKALVQKVLDRGVTIVRVLADGE